MEIQTRTKPLDSTVNIDRLVDLTESYTGADIAAVVNAAAMAAIREHLTKGEVERQKTKTENSEKGKDSKHKLTITFPHFETFESNVMLEKLLRNQSIYPWNLLMIFAPNY